MTAHKAQLSVCGHGWYSFRKELWKSQRKKHSPWEDWTFVWIAFTKYEGINMWPWPLTPAAQTQMDHYIFPMFSIDRLGKHTLLLDSFCIYSTLSYVVGGINTVAPSLVCLFSHNCYDTLNSRPIHHLPDFKLLNYCSLCKKVIILCKSIFFFRFETKTEAILWCTLSAPVGWNEHTSVIQLAADESQ